MSAPTRRQLAQVVVDRIRSGANQEQVAQELAAYLVEERRTRELDLIMRETENLRLQQDGVLEVTARSAFPINESIKSRVRQLFEADQIIVREAMDPYLVGGIKVEANDQVLDLSVRRQLNALKSATNTAARKGER